MLNLCWRPLEDAQEAGTLNSIGIRRQWPAVEQSDVLQIIWLIRGRYFLNPMNMAQTRASIGRLTPVRYWSSSQGRATSEGTSYKVKMSV